MKIEKANILSKNWHQKRVITRRKNEG